MISYKLYGERPLNGFRPRLKKAQLSAYPQTLLSIRWLARNYPPFIRQLSAIFTFFVAET